MPSSTSTGSSSITGERKRSRKEMEISSSADQLDNTNGNTTSKVDTDADQKIIVETASLLQGVVASLSGYDQHRKEELHQLILSLGGRYVTIKFNYSSYID
jgi:hypothetical protein